VPNWESTAYVRKSARGDSRPHTFQRESGKARSTQKSLASTVCPVGWAQFAEDGLRHLSIHADQFAGSMHRVPPDEDADPGLIREFVHTPIYKWVTNDYISGSSTEHVISRIAEILHELAPGVFRQPRY